jgi:hypothetical protein
MKKLCLFLPCMLATITAIIATSAWAQDQTSGQTPASPAQSPTASPGQPAAQAQEAERAVGTSNSPPQTSGKNRLFYALPNFLTVENAGNVPPLTTAQKFWLTTRDSFDPVEFGWYAALAGIAQAENSEPTYGQGALGYAKRYGERFGDGTIQNYMAHAVMPSLLHQDPRYYQLGKGGVWHRLGHAVGFVIITRSDSGTTQFNFSEIIGSGAAAAISTYTYHPQDDRNLGNVISTWGTQVAYDALGFVAKEFWPDIRNRLHKSKTGQAQ